MLAEIASRAISRWIHAVVGNKVRNRMRLRIFARLLRCDWLHLQKHHTGDLINRLEGDVNSITSLITETIPATVVVMAQLIASFLLLFSMSRMLALSVFVILPVCIIVSQFYVRRMRKLNRDVRDSDSRIQSMLQESLQHKELIKSLEQNKSTEKHLTKLQEKLHTQVTDRTKFSLGAFTFIQLGFAAGYLVAFLWGADSLRAGLITYGTMAAYLQLVGLIQRPTMDLTQYLPGIVSSLTAAERLFELEDIPMEKQGDAIMLKETAGVRFRNVDFKYEEGSRDILKDFCYDFPPNSSTAIIGETGAGKTTIIRLLVALINPDNGAIELYNDKEKHQSSTLTRRNFVYIPQGNSLVSGTIRDNLLMGNSDATEEEMKRALHIACADYVFELPEGIDSPVTEGGGGLSEGQAQRIAVARSILRPGSILILDEVTSALDEAREQEMLKRLTQSQIGKTLIFVTHRPAIMQYCNQVLRIEKRQTKD
jgi:ABC-type multidrug transport system fused ATPase/permease subunit